VKVTTRSVLAAAALVLGCLTASSAGADEAVIAIAARKFEYSKPEIVLKKGVPVVLELTSLDRVHGFNLPDLGLRAVLTPGKIQRLPFTPSKTGTFTFFCDVFCGDGHEEMHGTLIVTD
jgi:cytochrome c oxidase subunit 2